MKIDIQKGKANKIHILIDGDYQTTVDDVFWYSCGYHCGDELTEEEAEAFLFNAGARRAYNKALDLISRRDYSHKELTDRLSKNFDAEIAEIAVEKAESVGFINDEAYAEKFAEELRRRKKYSPSRIKRELIFRGIDRETAQNVTEALDINPRECIIELLNTKFSAALSDEKSVRRTFNTLLRMGYNASDIRSALREIAEAYDED